MEDRFEFRPMRRSRQQLSDKECAGILSRCSSGVLACLGDGGYPYAVPLSYVWDGEKLYFHCAKSGHKLDAVRSCDKASFCVTDLDDVVPDKYTTRYRSVIVFGRVAEITDDDAKRAAIEKLADKYNPSAAAPYRDRFIDAEWAPLCMLCLTPEHITGKQARELMSGET
ncbi:MAG: pyridoxamine 5'-phosphate oxidase family protein [Clostridiales bacterium]|nr:pyridoxamine 5'-phosphate oxidase family protein [Clostridiales bacterium]